MGPHNINHAYVICDTPIARVEEVVDFTDALGYKSHPEHVWVGHVMKRNDERWSKAVVEWYPREKKRLIGRPSTRRSDSLSIRYNVVDNRMRSCVH
ncbi:hypothetical protein ANCDUO_07609 [Ancylostoma duodenale]|uniref:Uncharacterized protein n=1 Tax=Ancylostoma duodenale TaxID=51022 RepID=A0A0C2GLK3_9BILA|nr:hypothetical protein ANCDUO_07609 [Ancylostoma duodenale]